MTKFLSGVVSLIYLVGPVAAGTQVSVPAPDIGGGIMGMVLAAGAVYLIKRHGRG